MLFDMRNIPDVCRNVPMFNKILQDLLKTLFNPFTGELF